MHDKEHRRLTRQIDALGRKMPILKRPSQALMRRGWGAVRLPFSALMIVGGLLSFLPVLGIWMLPLGLLFLAFDVPILRKPMSGSFIRARRWGGQRIRAFKRRRLRK
ncbi:hypothetical protein [Salipiger mucosus]|uniref:Tryptophan synthase subunit beta n=1 Tax=Salipiger mucosus DSM 16094 TaxID=1123237 RepID=S9QQA9_9RHOB|nr:hypothetical protein [Salipiger mucosus]EPX83576.1 hypothetical protein Salmuc_02184 [Salipiger mucosus DSM 16094]